MRSVVMLSALSMLLLSTAARAQGTPAAPDPGEGEGEWATTSDEAGPEAAPTDVTPAGDPAASGVGEGGDLSEIVARDVTDTTTEPAAGEEPGVVAEAATSPHVVGVGVKVGAVFPQITSRFGTTFLGAVEGSYLLPFVGSRFGLMTGLGYSRPTATGEGDDPRLGGTYSWEVVQQQLIWDLGAVARLNDVETDWNVGASLGPRMLFLFTTSDGEASGESFGEHFEPAFSMGLFLSGGGEYRLGPGALFGEVSMGTSFQNLRTTGDLAVVSVSALLGYRYDFML